MSHREREDGSARGEDARGDHLGFVAHEVRNPLSTALWSAELLARMNAEERGGGRGEKLTAMCLRSLGRVRQLIEDHFLCERLDARGIPSRPEAVPLHPLLEEIAGRRFLDLSAPEPAAGGTATRSLSDAERTGTRRRRRALAVLALLALVAAGGVAAAALRGIKAPAVEPVTGGVGEAAPARIPPPEGASAAVPARPPEPPPPPAATTERAAPPAPALGRLTVRVRPWADVWIDGARRAPIQGSESFSLPSGPHRVVVRGPAGATSSFRVTVRPGRTTVLPPSGGPLDVSAAPAAAR